MRNTCAFLSFVPILLVILTGCELPKDWFANGVPKNGTSGAGLAQTIDLSEFDGEIEPGTQLLEIPGLFEVRLYRPFATIADPTHTPQPFPDVPRLNLAEVLMMEMRGGTTLSEIHGVTLEGHRLMINSARFVITYQYIKGVGPDLPNWDGKSLTTKAPEFEGRDVQIILESKAGMRLPVPLFDSLGVEIASDASGGSVRVPDRKKIREWLISQVPKLISAEYLDYYFEKPKFVNVPKVLGTNALEKGMAKWIEVQREKLLATGREGLVKELGRDAVIDSYREQLALRLAPLPLYGNQRLRGTISKGPNDTWVFRARGSKAVISAGLESEIPVPIESEPNQGKIIVDGTALEALVTHGLAAYAASPDDKRIAYNPSPVERPLLMNLFRHFDRTAKFDDNAKIEIVIREDQSLPGPRIRPWRANKDTSLDLEVTFVLRNGDGAENRVDMLFELSFGADGRARLTQTLPGEYTRKTVAGAETLKGGQPRIGSAFGVTLLKSMVNQELKKMPAVSSLVGIETIGDKGSRGADAKYGEAMVIQFTAH